MLVYYNAIKTWIFIHDKSSHQFFDAEWMAEEDSIFIA